MSNTLIWQDKLPEHNLPAGADGIMQAQSLTVALRSLGHAFSVRLLHLGSSGFDDLFSDGLDKNEASEWFARDVLLCLDDTPVVWARSLCAASASEWRNMLDCGTRPLGERLFDGSLPLIRSPFEYAFLKDACVLSGFDGEAVLARRSLFDWHGKKLGLAECFLPNLKNFV